MEYDLTDAILLGLKRNKRMKLKPSSQSDIADHFGLSKPYVNQLINGRVVPTENTDEWIKKICLYVGIGS